MNTYKPMIWLISLSLVAGLAMAEEARIEYDHFGENTNASYAASLADGEKLTVLIKNTVPGSFTYEYSGVRAAPDPNVATAASGPTLEDKELVIEHDDKFGGYVVQISRSSANPVTVNGKDLANVSLLILVDTISWNLDFAGAFTIGGLTDPVFAAVTETLDDGSERTTVTQDTAAEDDYSLGLAAMIHTYHESRPNWALSFGLGVAEQGNTSYFVGPTYRFDNRAALTVGYQWGEVDRLPAGLSVGDPLTDANLLGDLPKRVDGNWFFSLSYGFVDVKSFFTKPFSGTNPSTSTTSNASQGSGQGQGQDQGQGGAAGDQGAPSASQPTTCVNCDGDASNDNPDADCDGDEIAKSDDPDDCNREVPGTGS